MANRWYSKKIQETVETTASGSAGYPLLAMVIIPPTMQRYNNNSKTPNKMTEKIKNSEVLITSYYLAFKALEEVWIKDGSELKLLYKKFEE